MNIKYSNGSIACDDAVKFLALTGMSDVVFMQMIKRREMSRKAAELGIMVSDDQLQKFADSFRAARGLTSAEDTTRWLSQWKLTEDEFEAFCEASVLTELLEEILADESKVQEYFANNRAEFDLARISVIRVPTETLANEVLMQIQEDGQDFHAEARCFSTDEMTRHAGGHMGRVSRGALSPEVAAKVFSAAQGDVLGPFSVAGAFCIYLVEEVTKADLSRNEVRAAVRDKIARKWVQQFLKDGVAVE